MPPRYLSIMLLSTTLLPTFEAVTRQRGKWIPTYSGPYLLQVSRTYNCPEEEWEQQVHLWLRTSHWNPYKPSELQILNGNVSAAIDITDEHWLAVTVDKRNNNQWKPNFMGHTFTKDACSIIPLLFADLVRAVFGDVPDPCVLRKGNYSVQNRRISWEVADIPAVPYGTYRLHVRAGQAGHKRPFLCFSLEGTAFPKLQA